MKNPWNYSNFKKGPLMSFVGVGLMLAAVYVYMKKPDSEMFSLTLLGLGALAMGLKDPRVPPKTGAVILMLIALTFLLGSCCSFKRCTQKYGSAETHTITIHDTVEVKVPVYLEPLTLEGSKPIQDILQGGSVSEQDTTGRLQVKFWYDKYKNLLHYSARVERDTIIILKNVPVKVKGDCPDTLVLDKEKGASGIARFWEQIKSFSVWLLLLFIVGMLMLGKYKKLKR